MSNDSILVNGQTLSSPLDDEARLGLTEGMARERLAEYGPNEIEIAQTRPLLEVVLGQVASPLVLVLWVAAGLSLILADWSDAIAILAIVVLNASLGCWQEVRAERAIESLRRLAAPTALVTRNGVRRAVPSREVVPGDWVTLTAGDRIPADLVLAQAYAMEADESILTGESLPVPKTENQTAYAGATVTKGRAEGVVIATGAGTEFGKIARAVGNTSQPDTPLQMRMAGFGRRLSLLAIALVALVVAVGLFSGNAPTSVVLTALSMAVAVVPEGLPAMVTVALAIGAQRMLRRGALVRRLDAIETLGCVTTICSDKTGTLTENRLRVVALWPEESRTLLLTGLALCNDAKRSLTAGFEGDPTEVALVVAAEEGGIFTEDLLSRMPRILEVPFSSETKLMTTVHSVEPGRFVSFTKGSVDSVLDLCVPPVNRAEIHRQHNAWAADGLRLLALAHREYQEEPDLREIGGLTFVGLVAMADTLRQEAKGAIAEARQAGIRVMMITGDHALTAERIATELGFRAPTGVTSAEINPLSLATLVRDRDVYARVSPSQKLEITAALQDMNEVVAVTGDGVNDAPALKKASVGVAMGRSGTDVAREAADVVLLDDNFATIVAAVAEGRTIYANMRKFIRFVMAGNVGEILVMLVAPLLGMPLPLAPLQILWINLVTDGLPGLALTLEPAEEGLMSRPPIPAHEPILARGLLADIAYIGATVALVPLALGYIYWREGDPAWRSVLFTSLTMCQLWGVIALRSSRQPLRKTHLGANPLLIGTVVATALLQCSLLYVPALADTFDVRPLALTDLVVVVAASSAVLVLIEARKRWLTLWFRRLRKMEARADATSL